MYRPRRPRSSSDALSASFNGDLLESRQHCNSYDNLGQGESDGDDGPICVPALISPPRSADDVDLSPPDIGMASLDFDPMSFQCSLPLAETSIFSLDTDAGSLKRSPGSASASEPVSPIRAKVTSHSQSPEHRPALGDTNKLPSASEKIAVQSVEISEKSTVLTPLSIVSESSASVIRTGPECATLQASPPSSPLDSPANLSSLSRSTDLPLSEAIQQELLFKAATFESKDNKDISNVECSQPPQATCSQEQPGKRS